MFASGGGDKQLARDRAGISFTLRDVRLGNMAGRKPNPRLFLTMSNVGAARVGGRLRGTRSGVKVRRPEVVLLAGPLVDQTVVSA